MAKRMQRFILFCPSRGAQVRHRVSLPAAPAGPGVSAWVYTDGDVRIGLIADFPNNQGVSATNGFESYAATVCQLARAVPYQVTDLVWFEYDTLGRFDEAVWSQDSFVFRPLQEGHHPNSTREAFLARIWRLAPSAVEHWRDVINAVLGDVNV